MANLDYILTLTDQPRRPATADGVDLLLVPKAGFWVRVVAYLLDQLLLNVLILILGLSALVILTYGGVSSDIFNLSPIQWLKYMVALSYGKFILEGVYYTFLHGYSGQTVGKLIMNLRVVTTAGAALSYRQAFKRLNAGWDISPPA
jgi:uncharacterized RDD family membrane protein YckC